MTSDIVKRQRTVAQTKQVELKWQRTIPPALQNGTVLHVYTEDLCELNATTRVDEFGFFLSWKADGKEGHAIDMNHIKEIRTGGSPKDSKTLNEIESTKGSGPIEVRTFIVVSGDEMVNVTMTHFVAKNSDTCKELVEGLLSLINNQKLWHISPMMYLKKYWVYLSTVVNPDGNVVAKNIYKLFGCGKSEKQTEQILNELNFSTKRGDEIPKEAFTFDLFHQLYLKMCPRTDIEAVFKQVSMGKEYIKVDQLINFLNNEMRDPRLNELLYPLAKKDTIKKLLETVEKDEKYREMEVLSYEGFYNFCMSDENAIIFFEHLDITQDVDQPLSHYYASSSHNTYLIGRQFGGKSSVDIYRYVLIAGCRCIEIDAWDGKGEDQEPIVTHGKAMTTEVPLKDVIQAIKETAFLTSDYPVVISIENHLNKTQQYKMAKYFEEIFGDLLLRKSLDTWPLEPGVPLPPPYALKNKILLKNKRLKIDVEQQQLEMFMKGQEFSVEGEESAPPDDPNAPPVPPAEGAAAAAAAPAAGPAPTDDAALAAMAAARHVGSTLAVHPYLSQMINYVQAVKFVGFDVSEEHNVSFQISSFSEVVGLGLMKQSANEFVNYNKRQLSRIYPKGNRVDSSNYMPQVFWNAGCQYVALNFQTPDLSMQLNQGKFEYQGGCGYILKPDFMRRPDRTFDPFSESPVDGVIAASLKIQIIAGYFLTDKKIGTYVEVEMYGLPTDTIRKEHRTKVVSQNALNPVYNEEPFVFRKIVLPDLAVVRFAVYDETGHLIGQRVIPFESMRAGYRHVQLRNEYNYPLPLATLFIKAEIKSYVPEGMANFVDALSDPKAFMSQAEKRIKAMASMGIDEGDIMHDDPLTKKKAAESKKPVAKVGPQQQGPGATTAEAVPDKNEFEKNTPVTLRETKQILRLRRTHAKEIENLRKSQQKERIEMHRQHCQKIDKLVIAVEKTRQAEERKSKGKLSSSVSMPNLTAAGKGGAMSASPSDLDSFINQQTAEIRSLVEEQTKEWTQLVLSQLEKDYELRKTHINQEYDMMRTIIGPVQAQQLKLVQSKHAQEQKDLKSQQARVSVETAKQISSDKSISNRAERDRRLRETNENNTKKFVEERKRQVMKQSQQLEKLKKSHEEEVKNLQKDQDHDLALLKNSYEEAKLATKTETVI